MINIINTSNPKKIYAVDVSEKSIYLAKKRAKLHNLNVSFIKINENEKIDSIDDNSIDVIKSDGVLHHIENIDFVLREFKRILKKNGVINLMIYNRDSLWFHLHVNYELMVKKKFLPITLMKKFLEFQPMVSNVRYQIVLHLLSLLKFVKEINLELNLKT